MTGIIVSNPPTVEVPPGNNSNNPSSLPGVTYQYAILAVQQGSTGGPGQVVKQTTFGAPFTVGLISPSDLNTTTQTVTSGASVVIASTDSLITVNKTSGSATAGSLPLSAAKNGAVLIVDFKGDSDVNPITITTTGSDKFPGNLSTWTISSQGACVLFTPIAGLGYAVT